MNENHSNNLYIYYSCKLLQTVSQYLEIYSYLKLSWTIRIILKVNVSIENVILWYGLAQMHYNL